MVAKYCQCPALALPKPEMATLSHPSKSREVVRCDQCHLVQFKTVNNLCRRCRTSLDEDENLSQSSPHHAAGSEIPGRIRRKFLDVQVGREAIRSLRQRSRLEPAATSVAHGGTAHLRLEKMQNEKATPTIVLAGAAGAGAGSERVRSATRYAGLPAKRRSRSCLSDTFLAELAEFTSELERDATVQRSRSVGHGLASATGSIEKLSAVGCQLITWQRFGWELLVDSGPG